MDYQPIITHLHVNMADEKRIVIEIVGGGKEVGSSSMSTKFSVGSEGKTIDETSLNIYGYDSGNNSNMGEFVRVSGTIAGLAGYVASAVGGQALEQINEYFVLTENYKSQQTISNLKSIGSGVGGILGSIGTGAAIGSGLGPWGAAAGATIGLGVGVFRTVMGGKEAQFEQNLDISTKGYSVAYNRNLVGLLVGESRNTEN